MLPLKFTLPTIAAEYAGLAAAKSVVATTAPDIQVLNFENVLIISVTPGLYVGEIVYKIQTFAGKIKIHLVKLQ
jgi:hypothetical protein